jgi:hypothetical protein
MILNQCLKSKDMYVLSAIVNYSSTSATYLDLGLWAHLKQHLSLSLLLSTYYKPTGLDAH